LPAGYAIFFPQEYGPVGSLSVRAIWHIICCFL
jgi:hypothetical protein